MMYAMALPKNPTNLDLLYEIREVKSIAVDTRKLAKKTNGRVDRLEDWRIGLDAIADDRLKRRRSPKDYLWQALILLGSAMAIIATLVERQ